MWNLVLVALRQYIPVVALPVAVVVGFIGYNAETVLSDKHTEGRKLTVAEERDERILQEMDGKTSDGNDNRYSKSLPQTVLNRNDFRRGFYDSTLKKDV